MASYTLFVMSPRITMPSSNDEGLTWQAYVAADMVMLNAQNEPVSPYGITEAWASYATLQSVDPVVASDNMGSIKSKLLAAVRPNYAPLIAATDWIRVVWLDDGGLLNL